MIIIMLTKEIGDTETGKNKKKIVRSRHTGNFFSWTKSKMTNSFSIFFENFGKE